MKKTSFTLIELLVVIVIIGILAGMLFPALSKAKEYGRSAKCKGNLKQLQIAAMSYFYEHEALPYVESTESNYDGNGNRVTWHQNRIGWLEWLRWQQHAWNSGPAPGEKPPWWGDDGRTGITNGTLWQYTGKSYKMYLCPTFALSSVCGSTAPDGSTLGSANPVLRSYAMNSHAGGIAMTQLGDADKHASSVLLFADISETNWVDGEQISERGFKDNNPDAYDGVLTGTNSTPDYPFESIGMFHNRHGNAVFIDGHVETLPRPGSTIMSDTTNACSGNW